MGFSDSVVRLMDSFLDSRSPEAKEAAQVARVHRLRSSIQARHLAEVRRFERRQASNRRYASLYGVIAGAAGAAGVLEVLSAGAAIPGQPWMWLGGSAWAAVVSIRCRLNVRHAMAPNPPYLPPMPVRSLPPDFRGHQESARFAALNSKLRELVPTVAALLPEAGDELSSAIDETCPLLTSMVERLRMLNGVERDMPGTAPANSAGWAGEEVRVRLQSGCDALDRLLSATVELLAAPDPARSAMQSLAPAVDSLTAYAHGLRTAYEWA